MPTRVLDVSPDGDLVDPSYTNARSSLDNVDQERGQRWSPVVREDAVASTRFTKVRGR